MLKLDLIGVTRQLVLEVFLMRQSVDDPQVRISHRTLYQYLGLVTNVLIESSLVQTVVVLEAVQLDAL